MAVVQPAPTYELPIIVNEKTGKGSFSPLWLNWFLQLTQTLNQSGGATTQHNSLGGLQGGGANQLYHLTLGEHTRALGNYTTLPSGITVTASPFTFHNTSLTYDFSVIVKGGTVSLLEFSRDNATFFDVGVVAGMFLLSPGDYIRATYTGAPTMTLVPR